MSVFRSFGVQTAEKAGNEAGSQVGLDALPRSGGVPLAHGGGRHEGEGQRLYFMTS